MLEIIVGILAAILIAFVFIAYILIKIVIKFMQWIIQEVRRHKTTKEYNKLQRKEYNNKKKYNELQKEKYNNIKKISEEAGYTNNVIEELLPYVEMQKVSPHSKASSQEEVELKNENLWSNKFFSETKLKEKEFNVSEEIINLSDKIKKKGIYFLNEPEAIKTIEKVESKNEQSSQLNDNNDKELRRKQLVEETLEIIALTKGEAMTFDEYFQVVSADDHYWGTSTWEEYTKIIEEQKKLYNQAKERRIFTISESARNSYEALITGFDNYKKNYPVSQKSVLDFVDATDLLKELKRCILYNCCGCYVFLIFDEPVINNDYSSYNSVYVGQSENVGKRVRNHLTGHGNGDVYADFKYGKFVYVKMIICDYDELDGMERDLIFTYDAQNRGYNKTQGGSKGF